MAKKVFLYSVQPDPEGPVFGRVLDPVQIQKAQDYAHQHTIDVTRDLLMAGAAGALVAGFGATLTAGMGLSIAVGQAIDPNGYSYGLDDAAVIALAAADPVHPRIDLIYATVTVDTPAESELTLFRQLRTQAELETGVEPYVPTQYNQPTELHTRVSIAVYTGAPGTVPVAPNVAPGQIPLWRVHVASDQTTLGGGDLTDVRPKMKSLYQVVVDIATFNAAIDAINGQLVGVELVAHKGAAGGYASLDGTGKVPVGQLPPIHIANVFSVASQAAMLALAADAGDVAIRTDINESFILSAAPATTPGNWTQLLFPTGVATFNGRPGAVNLTDADVIAALGFVPAQQGAFVLKAGDTMTGLLTITYAGAANTPAFKINNGSGDGILIENTGDVAYINCRRNGTSELLIDSHPSLPLVAMLKSLNDGYLVDMENTGGRGWGLRFKNTHAGSGEPLLVIEDSSGAIVKVIQGGKVSFGKPGAEGVPDLSGGGRVHMGGDSFRLDQSRTPAPAGSGKAGEFCWDGNYVYVCVAANTWKRAALVAY